MPSNDHCCVPFCVARQSKTPNLSFHTFPKDTLLKKKWIIAVKRDEGPEFHVTKSTVVCSDHFVTSDYATGKCQGSTSGPSRSGKTLRHLKKDAVPSVFSFHPLPKCRLRPTLRDNEVATNLPVYGPPTYQTWLEDQLHITRDLLDKELSQWRRKQEKVGGLKFVVLIRYRTNYIASYVY